MAVRVVLDVPGAGGLARLMRGVALLLGVVLMLAAILAAVYPLALAVIIIDTTVDGSTIDPLSSDDQLGLAISLGIVIIGSWLGVRLIRGRRRLGLYLRKFGYGDATRAVSQALRGGVGRRVRFVTLDDAMVAPLGVSKAPRRIAWLVCVVCSALAAWWLYWAFGGPSDQALEAAGGDANEAFTVIVTLFIALVGLCLALSIALFAGSAYRSARAAERFATRAIDSDRIIEPTAREIARLSRRVFSPRLVVVRVASPIWQPAVYGLGRVSDVVIIDISHPTDALLWEVTNMKPLFGDRWVLVGAYDQVYALAHPHAGLSGDPRGLLARLLEGEEVLAYGHTPADHRRFLRALRNRLHRAASAPRPAARVAAMR